ncbi:MAG: ATP-dependent protease La (EC Type I [uncultured Campylobacterales bacterium]|uniref:Lon protease n=1 Tax=uncultured Campylobacterales bacterium TaxID=352960 RepID=A0A6S6T9I8_9BACT|nr:MAG: ATP-dependent protease La (EC Type I [uncultured Campylobacterales bacterium]
MTLNKNNLPNELPLVSLEDDMFLYPFMITPIYISNQENIDAIDYSLGSNSFLVISPKKTTKNDKDDGIYDIGVVGSIMRKIDLGNNRIKILFQGLEKIKIIDFIASKPKLVQIEEISTSMQNPLRQDALMSVLIDKLKEYISVNDTMFSKDIIKTIKNKDDANRTLDLVISLLKIDKEFAYKLFKEVDLENKFLELINYLAKGIEAGKLKTKINLKVNTNIEKINKEYFLKQHLKQIQKELGEDLQKDEEIQEYKDKYEKIREYLEADAKKEIEKQIKRLSNMSFDSSEANTIQTYLDWVLDIPFDKRADNKLEISDVEKQLDLDHYGLDDPKSRIVEFFAVRQLLEKRKITEKESKGTVICFSGPPGVGKTSLANSIAKALNRKLVRIALGGLEDVNELRGHRRTYIGAMPGRIVQGLIDKKEINPVMVLDEIDKISSDNHKGDPTAVLLEILDPEQNTKYRDYYLNFDIDLSSIIFIATANNIGNIPAPLRDRMEFIHLSSYTGYEKFQIAKNYLLPQEIKKHGLKDSEVTIGDETLKSVIENYTREAGVRNLRQKIAKILRKVTMKILDGKENIEVKTKDLKEYLKKKVFEITTKDEEDTIGRVNGLAWTSVGGDVLKVEATKTIGKGNIKVTGSLGNVMKESAQIAYTIAKTIIDQDTKADEKPVYSKYDLHIHVPEGATPKDGPSAGITMTTAILSVLQQKRVKSSVAMTGEITLNSDVLPIGGLKEKIIAAYKAGISTVLIPQKNYDRDLDDIPEEIKKNLKFVAVKKLQDVTKIALGE